MAFLPNTITIPALASAGGFTPGGTSSQILLGNGTPASSLPAGLVGAAEMPAGIDAAKIGAGAVSNTEFGYLDGVTSAIQTQLAGKAASTHSHSSTYCYARCTAGVQGGGGGELDITWDGSLYFEESETFRNAANKKQLIVPTGKGGKYKIRALVNILNNGTGASFLRVRINGTEMDRVSVSGPAGAYQQLVLEYRATLAAGDVITTTVNVVGNGYFIGDGYAGVKGGSSIAVESWS